MLLYSRLPGAKVDDLFDIKGDSSVHVLGLLNDRGLCADNELSNFSMSSLSLSSVISASIVIAPKSSLLLEGREGRSETRLRCMGNSVDNGRCKEGLPRLSSHLRCTARLFFVMCVL